MGNSWPITPLGSVLRERQETPSTTDIELGKIRIVGKIVFDEGKIRLRDTVETKTGMILVRPGDLVVSGINAIKGAIAFYDETATEPIAATIHYGAYIPDKERVDTRFLWWQLRSRAFQNILLSHLPNGIKTELKPTRLLAVPIPLPSLAEQQRIVARIEELARRVEEARGLRQAAVEEGEALLNSTLTWIIARLEPNYGSVLLDKLLLEASYGTSVKCNSSREDGAFPVLRIPNVALERITLNNLKYGQLERIPC
ncbi:MAG: restriction endonuclease subunit S [Anaerolineae bacterium]